MPALPLENALYRRSFDDGWLDMVVGAGIAATGGLWLVGAFAFAAALPAILIPLWIAGRSSWITPRQAAPTFKSSREAAARRVFGGWLLFGVGLLVAEAVIFAMSRSGAMPGGGVQNWIVALPNALIGVGLLAGLALGAKRFIAYAIGAFAIGMAGVLANLDEPGWLIAATGAGVLLSGTVMLVRFLRAHPRQGLDAHE